MHTLDNSSGLTKVVLGEFMMEMGAPFKRG